MSDTKDGKLFPLPDICMDDVGNLLSQYRSRHPQIRGFDIAVRGNIAFEITIADCGETRLQAYFKSSLDEELVERIAHAFFDSLEQAWNAIQDDCVDWLWSDEI